MSEVESYQSWSTFWGISSQAMVEGVFFTEEEAEENSFADERVFRGCHYCNLIRLQSVVYVTGKIAGENWSFIEVHLSENDAAKTCSNDMFLLECKIGERFPRESANALKLYWPTLETWEESTLYKTRNA